MRSSSSSTPALITFDCTGTLFEPTASGRAARVLVLSDSPGVLAAMREDDGVIDAGEDYGGTPVDPTQLSALVGAPRLGV